MTRACKRNETKHTYKSVHKRVKGALAAALKPRRHSESNPRHTAPEVTTPPMLPRLAPRQATTPHTPRRSAFVAALPRTATRVDPTPCRQNLTSPAAPNQVRHDTKMARPLGASLKCKCRSLTPWADGRRRIGGVLEHWRASSERWGLPGTLEICLF